MAKCETPAHNSHSPAHHPPHADLRVSSDSTWEGQVEGEKQYRILVWNESKSCCEAHIFVHQTLIKCLLWVGPQACLEQ